MVWAEDGSLSLPKQWDLSKGLHRIHSCRLQSAAFPQLPQFHHLCSKVTRFAALPPAG